MSHSSQNKLAVIGLGNKLRKDDGIGIIILEKIALSYKRNSIDYFNFGSKSFDIIYKIQRYDKVLLIDAINAKINPGELKIFELKDIEWKLPDKLRKNGNVPVMELAKELKTTANTVVRKMNYLKQNGIIERYYPIVDINKLGMKEYTYISRIDPSYDKQLNQFLDYAKKDPRFGIIIKAVGYVNLYYAFYVENDAEMKEITSKIERFFGRGVLETYRIEVEEMIN